MTDKPAYLLFARSVVLGSFLYALIAILINAWIDPWQILGPPKFETRNDDTNFERISLAHEIRRAKSSEVLLLGSSRVRYILGDGGNRLIESAMSKPYFGEMRVFNAALAGANIHVVRRVFEHALHYQSITEVVLLLDDVMLNKYRPAGMGWKEQNYFGDGNYQNIVERYLELIDFSMLSSSLKLLFSRMKDRPPKKAGHVEKLEPQAWMHLIEEFSRRDLYGCYEIDAETIRELELIFELAQKHGVRLTVIASFIHPTLAEYFFRGDNGTSFIRFLSVVRESAVRYQLSSWFVSPYSKITNGTPLRAYDDPSFLGAPDFYDPGHANLAAYRKILNAVFSDGTGDMVAMRLDTLSLSQIDAKLRRSRDDYLLNKENKFWDRLDSLKLVPKSRCP